MSKHIIQVSGCDDSTAVPMELTDTELATIKKLADAVNAAATYECKPRIVIDPKSLTWDESVAAFLGDVAEVEEKIAAEDG